MFVEWRVSPIPISDLPEFTTEMADKQTQNVTDNNIMSKGHFKTKSDLRNKMLLVLSQE